MHPGGVDRMEPQVMDHMETQVVDAVQLDDALLQELAFPWCLIGYNLKNKSLCVAMLNCGSMGVILLLCVAKDTANQLRIASCGEDVGDNISHVYHSTKLDSCTGVGGGNQ